MHGYNWTCACQTLPHSPVQRSSGRRHLGQGFVQESLTYLERMQLPKRRQGTMFVKEFFRLGRISQH